MSAPRKSPFNDAFATLAAQRDSLPPGPAAPQASTERQGPARAVVRYERKGHGGKELTLIEQLELLPWELDQWIRELKTALGCGGKREGRVLQVQGDQRERVRRWLEERGVRKITVA